MKKNFTTPIMEITKFDCEDVITTSTGYEENKYTVNAGSINGGSTTTGKNPLSW